MRVENASATLHRSVAAPGSDGSGFSWRRLGAAVPSVAFGLLPKIACPACWPAYAGVLSSFGVSFLIDARYLFALTAAFLAVALFFLGFRAHRRRGYGPLMVGSVASAVLLIGKFYLESDPAMFSGVGLLMGASFWNSWPRRLATSPACSVCEPSAEVRSCCDATTSPPATACCESPTQGESS
ncbi:MAG: MerC domain-containing protein [Deltaproteobacteria bacterium]|nr:MerC domain-containing protein [Deltaproteobacteria bacterium]